MTRRHLLEAPGLDVVEELQQRPEVRLLIVPHGEMAVLFADVNARVRDELAFPLNVFRVHLVEAPDDEQRRHRDPQLLLGALENYDPVGLMGIRVVNQLEAGSAWV
jgi:hypothetical protein